MNEIVFKIIFAVLWIIFIVIRIPFDKKYKQQQKIKILDSKKEKLLILLLALGLLLIPLIWMLTPFLDSFHIEFPDWLRFFSIAISLFSLYFFFLVHKTLDQNWSPMLEIMEGHQFVKIGVYKRIRHPMYLQILLWSVAQFFILSNTIAGSTGLFSWAVFYFSRVQREEKMMVDYFGEEYYKYKLQTGRILPKIKHINDQ